MISKSSLLALSFSLTISCGIALAQETRPDEKQIRAWIEQLANGGSPRKFKTPNDRLTREDRDALKPVIEAYRKLGEHFMLALPFLVKGVDDKRFSYPSEHPSSAVFENQTVGNACRSIIGTKIELFRSFLTISDDRGIPVCPGHYFGDEWYSKAKGKNLYELQLEAIEWGLRQPPPARTDAEQWKDCVARLRKFREGFVREGKALNERIWPPIEGK